VYEAFAGHSISTGKKYYGHLSKDEINNEILEKVYHIEDVSELDNNKILALEDRVKKLEGLISNIIEKANLVFDSRFS
jgi:hypothetical protein